LQILEEVVDLLSERLLERTGDAPSFDRKVVVDAGKGS
jgi:hypothetical protein